jgi:ectoine hydroxylase-related dioxygenase (phytanoyl-CoA dioxygenase family)
MHAALYADRTEAADALAARLLEDGYLILEEAAEEGAVDAFAADLAAQFEAADFGQGLFYGDTTKRFGRLFARSAHAARLALAPRVFPVVEAVLADPAGVQINLTQAIEIHPGAPAQVPHRDHHMWPVDKQGAEFMVNVMWPLDDFTAENGATRIWPGSQRAGEGLPDEDAVEAVAPRGSAILFLGSVLHSGGANRSAAPRRGAVFSYCRAWLLPNENPWLAYPPEVARTFPPDLAALVGYRQRFAGLNNFEGQCPSVLLGGERRDFYSFGDHLTDEQKARIQAYYDAA